MHASDKKMLSSQYSYRSVNSRHQAGLSLVELMISITIGLLLLAGVTALIAQQSSARSELEKSSRQIENGRYAMQILQDDIRHAGFYGQYYNLPAAPATLPDPCETAYANLGLAMPLPIQGYDSPASVPSPLSACLPNANHKAETDILVIRRADTTTPIAISSAVANQVYLQTGWNPTTQAVDYKLGTGSDKTVFTLQNKDGTLASLRKYLVHIYFVSPCSVPTGSGGTACTSTDDTIRTLKRLELSVDAAGTATTFVLVPLAEGIDNLQLDYGTDTAAGDGSPHSYTTGTYSSGTTAMTPADWGNVMAVRVNLLARNNDPTGGYKDTKTYSLGAAGTVGPFNDTYKRHAFSELVRAINPSGRRDK